MQLIACKIEESAILSQKKSEKCFCIFAKLVYLCKIYIYGYFSLPKMSK